MDKVKKELPILRIGKHQPLYPIVQGGMGVMVSGPRLAGAVASVGGIGTIASVGLAVASPDFDGRCTPKENMAMLRKLIGEARAASNGGVLAVNCMCALADYDSLVRTSCESGIDIIVSGAGLPLKLPELTQDYPDTALVPIVSSVKAAHLIISRWGKHYGRLPDAIVVETPNCAGGHLGARDAEQAMDPELSLQSVVPVLVSYLKENNYDIPVIAAGGIWDGNDMADAFAMGAKGVQMGTRFAATEEGDASDRFKQAYLDAKDEDIVVIKSPCGLPGRAIRSPLVQRYLDGVLEKVACRTYCLTHCICRLQHETFCIADALISAYKGDWENGLFFCGSNVSKVNSIVKVKDLMCELLEGFTFPEMRNAAPAL
ncbi:MAG: nitronate monooxygenase family protein [Synergistaceae bacterium]|nr:nitronate monooxygenase family protein [Synergistaceae bacterium]